MALTTWDQSSFKWRREDTDLEESVNGLEGEVVTFPLSGTICEMSVFNLLLAWEDYTGDASWVACTIGLTRGGGGNGSETVDQPR
jgi:hypothetical protein